MTHKFYIPYTVGAFDACMYCIFKNDFDKDYSDFDNILKIHN